MNHTKMSLKYTSLFMTCSLLAACASTGDSHRADVYSAYEVNQKQAVKTVQLIAVMPARVEVDNSEARGRAQLGGALVGALAGAFLGAKSSGHHDYRYGGAAIGGVTGGVAGSMVSDTTLVDGVSLTYTYDGETFNSAQVGKLCEYTPGLAVMISKNDYETRIQPNATCTKEEG